MTADEYRAALSRLSPEQLEVFRERWGGGRKTVDESVQEFVYSDDKVKWERIIIYWLRELFGIDDLQTEDQKALDIARDSANAASDSARAAEASADSAAASVRWAKRSAFIAVISALVTIVFSALVAVLVKGCVAEAPR